MWIGKCAYISNSQGNTEPLDTCSPACACSDSNIWEYPCSELRREASQSSRPVHPVPRCWAQGISASPCPLSLRSLSNPITPRRVNEKHTFSEKARRQYLLNSREKPLLLLGLEGVGFLGSLLEASQQVEERLDRLINLFGRRLDGHARFNNGFVIQRQYHLQG